MSNKNEIDYLQYCHKCTKVSDIGSYYCSKCSKAYDKTWYYSIRRSNTWPTNLVSGRPIRLFGIYLFSILKLATADYEWACSKSYQDECRCPKHNKKELIDAFINILEKQHNYKPQQHAK